MEFNFLRGELSNPWNSSEGRILLGYKNKLESMSDFLISGVDYRDITNGDINKWEKDLRGIIEGIKKQQNAPQIDALLVSCEGAQASIRLAINKLYLVSHILQKKNRSLTDMRALYQTLSECASNLSDTVDIYFKL